LFGGGPVVNRIDSEMIRTHQPRTRISGRRLFSMSDIETHDEKIRAIIDRLPVKKKIGEEMRTRKLDSAYFTSPPRPMTCTGATFVDDGRSALFERIPAICKRVNGIRCNRRHPVNQPEGPFSVNFPPNRPIVWCCGFLKIAN